MAGGAPITSAGVATRVSQERRSQSRSKLASSRLWRSRQARAMSPSWQCSSPMRAQSPCPLIVRQVSSHAASSGCSLPASRSPRAPVREGQRQRRPALTSALSSPTAQRGMVFAPSASRRQRSPGKTPCGCGWGEATGAFLSERDTHGHTPPSHNLRHHRGPVPLAVGEVYHHWSTRARRWRRTRRVWPIHPGPVAVGRGRSGCPS